MSCEFCEKISEYADGMLQPEESAEVEQHLETCEECTAFLNDIAEMKAELNVSSKLVAGSLRRAVVRDIKNFQRHKWIRAASAAAAAILIVVSIPVFLAQNNDANTREMQIAENNSQQPTESPALPTAVVSSMDTAINSTNNEIDLFFANLGNAGKEKAIYGFQCTYSSAQPEAATDSLAGQATTTDAVTQKSYAAASPITEETKAKYSIYVSGFESSDQEVSLRKALVGLSAPASKDILVTKDGSIPMNTLEALKLMQEQKLDIKIIFDPVKNDISSYRINLIIA